MTILHARKVLGSKLAQARQLKGLSAEATGRLIGLSTRHVEALEAGVYDEVLSADLRFVETKVIIYAKKMGLAIALLEPLIATATDKGKGGK